MAKPLQELLLLQHAHLTGSLSLLAAWASIGSGAAAAVVFLWLLSLAQRVLASYFPEAPPAAQKACWHDGEAGETDPLVPALKSEEEVAGAAPCPPPRTTVAGGTLSSLLLQIPSACGSWCWPLLLVTAFGASSNVASDEAREFSHHFTVGANLVVFSSLIWTVARGSMQAGPRRSCVRQWGPLFLVVTGCIVAMLDPMRHLLLDHGGVFFSPDALAMYVDGGPGLSLIGRFCQVSTVIGLCSLFVGMLCFLGIPEKVYEKVMEDASA